MSDSPTEHPHEPQSGAISNPVVRLISEYRGPTKAHAHGRRSLVRDGRSDLVLSMRKAYQDTMRGDLTSGMSDNHIDPDVAVESFVLEPVATSSRVT